MWLFTRYGYYSIACAAEPEGALGPDTLTIRARRKAHLQTLQARFVAIADAEIVTLPDRDYRYRLVVSKAAWVAVAAELAGEQEWSGLKSESSRSQSGTGSDYVNALHRVWESMYGLQRDDGQRTLIERDADGAIANADELMADDVAEQRVLCPACGRKIFASWPEGWDGHAAYACIVAGETPEERKANFKQRYRRLFR